MKLSLSVRIAETAAKDSLTIRFEELAKLAGRCGYHAVCMRPSVVGVDTSPHDRALARKTLDSLGVPVSMATTDLAVPLNNDQGPESLREIGPHLAVAETLGSDLIRICMKREEDIQLAQRAADEARERHIRLAHQCHTDSLFETVSGGLEVIRRVGRENFGIIYEPANLMLCGEDYAAKSIKQLAPHLFNVYVQNHRIDAQGRHASLTRVRGQVRYDLLPLWEEGGVDFQAVFEGLGAIGYNGYVTVHQAYAELMGPEEAAQRSADFLRGLAKFDPLVP